MTAVRAVSLVPEQQGATSAPRTLPVLVNPDDYCDACGAALIHTAEDPTGLRICPKWCHETGAQSIGEEPVGAA